MKTKKISFVILFIILLIFKTWIFSSVTSAGDFEYYSLQRIKDILPFGIWDTTRSGLGASLLSSLWLESYTTTTIKLASVIGWDYYIRIFWYFPYIIFSFISIFILFKSIFKNNYLSVFSSLIYAINTYSLMMIAGGQMGIALSYSLAPIVFYFFIKLINDVSFKKSLNFGLAFALVSLLDLRIGYMLGIAITFYTLFSSTELIKKIKSAFLLIVGVPLIITLGIHSFWLLPAFFSAKQALIQLGDIYTSSSAVKFFSFANMENSLGLLHPNWPENIFGKVAFMRPEFLMLPILAFISLLFIDTTKNSKEKLYILYFTLLGIIGAFLAKGANEPFGNLYLWMFNHVPGFVMFRDPTKWYLLVAISYSILIPFSTLKIYEMLKLKTENLKHKVLSFFPNLFIFLVLGYILFLIRPAVFGQLNGTFRPTETVREYKVLEDYLQSQNIFFRTLWIPRLQRLGFYSNLHPAISAQDLFNSSNPSELINKFKNNNSQQIFRDLGVKYIIIPYDSQREIFITDRKYNHSLYEDITRELRTIIWLKEINKFDRIHVFQINNPKDHFWSTSKSLIIKYQYLNSVEYNLQISNAKIGDRIIFSENYDPGWIIQNSNFKIQSQKYDNKFNSFVLPKDGNYSLRVYYAPQDYVNTGLVVSGISLSVTLVTLLFLKLKKK